MGNNYTYDNGHVQFKMTYNFSLDKLVSWLSKDALAAAMVDCRNYLEMEVKKRFTGERGPKGRKWTKLSPLTVKMKGGVKTKLFFKRHLYKSIRSIAYADQVILWTKERYARMMQEGASYRTTMKQSVYLWYNLFNKTGNPFQIYNIKIPPRPFFGFSDKNIAKCQQIIYKHIKKGENIGK